MSAGKAQQNRSLSSGPVQEEPLGKVVDWALIKRLWFYVSPYRMQVALTLVMIFPMFLKWCRACASKMTSRRGMI